MINSNDLDTVKAMLDRETVLALISHLGYSVNRNGMFKLRPEERTSSSSVDRNGKIKDFGSGWRGDIFDLLQDYYGLSFQEAFEYVATCLGVYHASA
jgi:hypothetical protein